MTRPSALEQSLEYLASEDAITSLRANVYWPKWNSPWWHLTLLRELGLGARIPNGITHAMTEGLKRSRVTIFPVHAHELPADLDVSLETHCHCGLGNIVQALASFGVEWEVELSWARDWFLRYQLPDGGLNCDNDAYLKSEPPSSMVGTVPPLEAMLRLGERRPLGEAELSFLDRGARCLLERELRLGSASPHNAEEREDETDWLALCFPRFYLYDVLRGLSFVLKWAERYERGIPRAAIAAVTASLDGRYGDGPVKIGRRAYDGIPTRARGVDGKWARGPASLFPLLEEVSAIGRASPELSAEWAEARARMRRLAARGLVKP